LLPRPHPRKHPPPGKRNPHPFLQPLFPPPSRFQLPPPTTPARSTTCLRR
jgi:hypothetical protein